MYVATVRSSRQFLQLVIALACFALLAASCGSSAETATTTVADEGVAETAEPADEQADDDHGDDDHDDEDHDDEDHDVHDDHDDHDDEDHDDHGDEDHDDHGDEDHDDHDHDDDSASGGLDAHVHGSAELFVAWSGGDVVIDFISPTNNIFGFEYEASTDEDIATVDEKTDVLTSPDLLAFNDDAGCSLAGDVDSALEYEGSHAEITTSWAFTCDNPDQINELDLSTLFEQFPRLQDLDAQWASDAQQSAAELSPSSTLLRFE